MGRELLWTIIVYFAGAVLYILDFILEVLWALLSIIAVPFRFVLCNSAWCGPGHSTPPVRVLIVGASFAGLAAARSLGSSRAARNKRIRITIVEARDYFEYTPGILRAFVEPSIASKLCCLLPVHKYDEVIRGYVTKISGDNASVSLVQGCGGTKDGEAGQIEVPFDYCILATGASYAAPVQQSRQFAHALTLPDRLSELKAHSLRLKSASSVVIVGGGPVGVELAAEVVSRFKKGAKKTITLVTSRDTLLGTEFTESTINYCTKWLVSRGVDIRYHSKGQIIDKESVRLTSGEVLRADMIYDCTGGSANSDYLVEDESTVYGTRKRIIVNDFLQLQDEVYNKRVFAAGDVMEVFGKPDIKLAFTAEIGGHLVAHNVAAAIMGKKLHSYPKGIVGGDSIPSVYCVSLGKSYASLGFQTITVNGFMAGYNKWLIETTKILCMRERALGIIIWALGDNVAFFLGRVFFKKKAF